MVVHSSPYIDLDEVYLNLYLKNVKLDTVTFSVCDDDKYDWTWLMAGTRHLNDHEIIDTIDYLVYHNIEEEFMLMNFDLGSNF